MPINKRKLTFKTKRLTFAAALTVFGTLTAGCGADSAKVTSEKPQAVSESAESVKTAAAADTQTEQQTREDDYLDKSDYTVQQLKPGQADLLNDLIRAQNAGDQEAYAALFASDTPEEAKRISFKIAKFELRVRSEGDGPQRIGAEFQEEPSGESYSVVYELVAENGQWKVRSAERAAGPLVDESIYEGDALEIAKLINLSIKYRNEGDAAAYRKLFGPGSNMNELQPNAQPVKEMQIADIHYSEADGASIVYPMIKREGETELWMPGYALLKKDGKWLIYDID
ncbi:hypothetical protein CDO73_13330 [Saccharibacillus sp. O23]|uniref:hypothetical protein n=1 Tax=Saccharibacillus sp. O23 TaxID=2009338 RepID=UPI000B4E6B76|nr:hypothetical protein [Saccharibacillus sp. O23]OWR30048.1 hypothetical protein CDO73_13330 [Saccharibacillus sp. O23]